METHFEVKKTLRLNGDTLNLVSVDRVGGMAVTMYEKKSPLGAGLLEVMLIKQIVVQRDGFGYKKGDVRISYPTTRDWGTRGWTFHDTKQGRADADAKYQELVSSLKGL